MRQLVADLAVNLKSEITQPETLAWVAGSNHGVKAHVSFSPVTIEP